MEGNIQFEGPQELVDKLLIYRGQELVQSSTSLKSLEEEHLRNLIILCYKLSMQKEEGRNLQFQLCVARGTEYDNAPRIVTINPPHRLDEETVRRLAFAVLTPTHALRVYWGEEGFVCDGIVSLAVVDARDYYPILGIPFEIFRYGIPDFVIQVQGPGTICITDRTTSWYLRDFRIQKLKEFHKISHFKKSLTLLTDELVLEFKEEFDDKFENFMKNSSIQRIDDVISFYWGKVLSSVIGKRHGGAFIILPDDSEDGIDPINRATGIDLDNEFKEFSYIYYELFIEGHGNNQNASHRGIQELYRKKESLHLKLESLACLANIDGCVVLDRRLRLVSFGAKISAPVPSSKRCFYVIDDKEIEFDITKLGTRHQSIYRLCALRPGLSAYVISQDGKLRVFFGQDNKVIIEEANATSVQPEFLRQ